MDGGTLDARYQPSPDVKLFNSCWCVSPSNTDTVTRFDLRTDSIVFARDSGVELSVPTTASTVPGLLSHASKMPESCSNSRSTGLARLPQPISGAAGHSKGTLKKLTRSNLVGVTITDFICAPQQELELLPVLSQVSHLNWAAVSTLKLWRLPPAFPTAAISLSRFTLLESKATMA